MATPKDYPMNWHTQTKIHLKEITRRARQRKNSIKRIPVVVGHTSEYERVGVYALDDVLAKIGKFDAQYDGHTVHMDSSRYELFARDRVCAKCGIEGLYFGLERNLKRVVSGTQPYTTRQGRPATANVYTWVPDVGSIWHFNLYGFNANGHEVMLTKDHALPKSLGGHNTQKNYQCMCKPCNNGKGSKVGTSVTELERLTIAQRLATELLHKYVITEDFMSRPVEAKALTQTIVATLRKCGV